MENRLLKVGIGVIVLLLSQIAQPGYCQNGKIGDGFGTNNWSTIDDFDVSAGSSRIATFTANATGNRYFRLVTNWGGNNNQWGPSSSTVDYNVLVGTEVPAGEIIENSISKAYYTSVPSTSYKYVFKTKEGGNPPINKGLIVFEVQGDVRSVTGVNQNPVSVYRNQEVTITATLDLSLNIGQGVYLRYTNDNFSTSTVVAMTGSGTSYTASIPSGTNTANASVKYYVFTSGNGLTITGNIADWYTINLKNNSGSNYSYSVNSSYLSKAAGNWSSTATWYGDQVPSTGEPVTINNNVTLDQNVSVSTLTINSGSTFTSSDASPRILTITKSSSGTATTISNSGTWENGTGGSTLVFTGAPSSGDAVHAISGTIPFQNITINKTGGSSNVGASFGTNSSVSGTLEIGSGGYVVSAPPASFYGSNAILKFNQGSEATYDVGATDNSWSTLVVPNYITISSGTVNLNADRTATGNLLIDGGALILNLNTPNLTIQGNWTRSSGSFTPGTGTVTLSGTTNTIISTASAATLYNLVVSKTGGAYVSMNSNLSVTNNMTISSGAIFKVESGKSLSVSGTLTNNATSSGLIIKSDATGTGSLVHSTSGVSGTVERYVTNADWAVKKDGWHFISAPVSSQAIDPAFTATTASEYDFYCWYEPGNVWVNFKNTTTAPTWNTANGSTNFTVGKGYMVAYDNGGTKQYTGTLNVSDVPVSGLTLSSGTNKGYHLLGNPFTCGLTWDASSAWSLTNINGVAKYWNEANQSYSDLTSDPSSTIPASSGFMVAVTADPGSLTIPESKRVTSALPGYKSTTPVIKLVARSIEEGNAQESSVYFNPEATPDFDQMFDSEFLPGFGPQFYSVFNGLNLSTNSLPEIISGSAIPFHFIKNEGANFSIEVSGLETLDPSTIVYLVDKKTGTEQNLIENPVYNFTSSAGDDPGRFELKFGAVGTGEVSWKPSLRAWFYNGQLSVENAGQGLLNVYNLQGQDVFSSEIFESGVKTFSLNLPSGIYVAQFTSPNEVKTVKIIVQ